MFNIVGYYSQLYKDYLKIKYNLTFTDEITKCKFIIYVYYDEYTIPYKSHMEYENVYDCLNIDVPLYKINGLNGDILNGNVLNMINDILINEKII